MSPAVFGCAFWLGLIALSVGVGALYGPGRGAASFGVSLAVLASLLAWVVLRRQRAAKAADGSEP